MRLIAVALISLIVLLPAMAFYSQVFGLSDNVSAIAAAITSIIVLPVVLLNIWKEKPGLEVMPVDPHDPIMAAQISRAKAELHRLIEGLNEGRLEAGIKFPLKIEDNTEHVWGIAHSFKDGFIIASLASPPVGNIGQEYLDRMSIPVEDIEDLDAQGERCRKIHGGYTMLALARIYKREHGKIPKQYRRLLGEYLDFDSSEVT